MASTYSANLKIELIGTGDQVGDWGDTTNDNLGTALEEAIVGYGAVQFTNDANLTLSLSDSNASQTARNYYLYVTSLVSLSTTRDLIVPTIEKPYVVHNATSGSQSIRVKTAAGTGITVPTGKKMILYVNGTNVVEQADYATDLSIGNLTIDTPLPVLSGGTGASTATNARTNLGLGTISTQNADNVSITGGSITSDTTEAAQSVNDANDAFIVSSNANKYNTGLACTLTTTGTLPAGLVVATTYYLIRNSATSVSFATSLANAVNGTKIVITGSGSGTHSIVLSLSLTGSVISNGAMNGTIVNGNIVGANSVGARTVQAVSAGTPTGGSDGDIVYQY